jgi:hypothetical protein
MKTAKTRIAVLISALILVAEFASAAAKPNILVRPPHSPTPVPVLTVSGAAGAKAIS